MKTLYGFVLLSRPMNVLMVLLTGLAVKWGLVDKVFVRCGLSPSASVETGFAMLMGVLMLLTASGNIINDYFDVRVDRINKPQRVVIDKLVKRRWAIVTHFFLNAIAVLAAALLYFNTGNPWMLIVPFGLSLAVWFYSSTFKKQFLTGNVLVALMVSTVPILTGLYFFDKTLLANGTEFMYSACSSAVSDSFHGVIFYTCFAFALTLIREIQKDLEDLPGDSSEGFKTMAIVLGNKVTRRLCALLLLVVIASLLIAGPGLVSTSSDEKITWAVFVGLILLPLALSVFFSLRHARTESITQAQKMTKVAMLGGLLLLMAM